MKRFNYLLMLVILTEHTRSCYAHCRTVEVKSNDSDGEEGYINSWGQHECCRPHYSLLYSYVVCNFVTLDQGHKLYILGQNHNVNYIVFKDSEVPVVPVGVFSEFQTLLQLYLNNSHVNTIHPGAFNGLAKLEELHLENNNMTELSRGTLNSLSDLQLLNMSNNKLAIIEENAFSGILNLNQIDFSYNHLKNLSPNVFQGLRFIHILNLSHNYISEISSTIFSKLFGSELELNLSFNNLKTVNCSDFPLAIQNLYIANNHIEYLENLEYLSHLQRLDVSKNLITNMTVASVSLNYLNASNNKIEHLSDITFHTLPNVHTIDFSFNVITNLHEDSFLGLSFLNSLYLQNNKLNQLPVGCFRDLNQLFLLNISSNHVTEFVYGTFLGLNNLHVLDISNNSLTDLFEGTFHSLTSLTTLNIGDNFLTSFDSYNFLIYITHLETINLNNNPWNCKSLLKITTDLKNSRIEGINGPATKIKNVHGIACIDYSFNNTKELNSYLEISNNNQNFSTNSKELEMVKNYFNDDFLNSSFYHFFNNYNQSLSLNVSHDFLKYFDNEFKNTTFYKYFNQNVSDTTFFKSFNQSLLQYSTAINNLLGDNIKTTMNKLSKSDGLTRGFSKYFENGYKNSSFFKYFTEDFANSNFFKLFNEKKQSNLNSTLIEVATELQLLRKFLTTKFKNFSYNHLLEQEYANHYPTINLSKPNNVIPDEFLNYKNSSRQSPSYEKLVDMDSSNRQVNQDILLKIGDLKNGITVLMIIVIIILLYIVLLFTLKNVAIPLRRSIKQAPGTGNNLSESTAGLELL